MHDIIRLFPLFQPPQDVMKLVVLGEIGSCLPSSPFPLPSLCRNSVLFFQFLQVILSLATSTSISSSIYRRVRKAKVFLTTDRNVSAQHVIYFADWSTSPQTQLSGTTQLCRCDVKSRVSSFGRSYPLCKMSNSLCDVHRSVIHSKQKVVDV